MQVIPPDKPKDEIPARFRSPRGTLRGYAGRVLNLETVAYRRFREATMPPRHDSYTRKADTDIHAQARAEYERDRQNREARYQDEMTRYRQAERVIGQPHLHPQDVFTLTARDETRRISSHSLLLEGGTCRRVPRNAHFER